MKNTWLGSSPRSYSNLCFIILFKFFWIPRILPAPSKQLVLVLIGNFFLIFLVDDSFLFCCMPDARIPCMGMYRTLMASSTVVVPVVTVLLHLPLEPIHSENLNARQWMFVTQKERKICSFSFDWKSYGISFFWYIFMFLSTYTCELLRFLGSF